MVYIILKDMIWGGGGGGGGVFCFYVAFMLLLYPFSYDIFAVLK